MRKQKQDGISLRAVYVWVVIAALILSGLMFYATYRLTRTFGDLGEAAENQIAMQKAAHELMDASDYLTERVQRFTVNGDMRFLREYFTEAFETARRESAIETMSGTPGFSEALVRLQQAMEESLDLMRREY